MGKDMNAGGERLTELLQAWSKGDSTARDRLMPIVYRELRRRAAAMLRRERRIGSLQPTALVHEAYLRLIEQNRADWRNQAQFYAVAAEIMRRLLVDRARAHAASKRSGQWSRMTLAPDVARADALDIDVLDLDAALTRLAEIDPRKSEIAQLRFFAGLSLHETSKLLELSPATVERDWLFARAWLFDALSEARQRKPA